MQLKTPVLEILYCVLADDSTKKGALLKVSWEVTLFGIRALKIESCICL